MQTLNIKVTQQAVILQNKDPVTAENVNQIRCVVELDPAYADLVVRVCMNGQFATVVDGQRECAAWAFTAMPWMASSWCSV